MSSTLRGVERLETTTSKPYKVDTKWGLANRGPYRLPPGESSTWSCLVEVPTGESCLIEVVVVGLQWPNGSAGQWRCSLVSLPVTS